MTELLIDSLSLSGSLFLRQLTNQQVRFVQFCLFYLVVTRNCFSCSQSKPRKIGDFVSYRECPLTWRSIPRLNINQGIGQYVDRLLLDQRPTVGCGSLATSTDNQSTIGGEIDRLSIAVTSVVCRQCIGETSVTYW